MSSAPLVVETSKIIFFTNILYSKGGYDLTLDWAPSYPVLKTLLTYGLGLRFAFRFGL